MDKVHPSFNSAWICVGREYPCTPKLLGCQSLNFAFSKVIVDPEPQYRTWLEEQKTFSQTFPRPTYFGRSFSLTSWHDSRMIVRTSVICTKLRMPSDLRTLGSAPVSDLRVLPNVQVLLQAHLTIASEASYRQVLVCSNVC